MDLQLTICGVVVSKLVCFCTMIRSYKHCYGGAYTFLLAIWDHYIQYKQHTDHEVPNWSEYTGYMEFCTRNRKHNHGIITIRNWYCMHCMHACMHGLEVIPCACLFKTHELCIAHVFWTGKHSCVQNSCVQELMHVFKTHVFKNSCVQNTSYV